MKINNLLKIICSFSLAILVLGCGDDETPPSFSSDFAGVGSGYQEKDGDVTMTIPFRNVSKTLSAADLTFSGSATEDEDYQILGVTSEGVQLKLINDDAAEKVEEIKITITGNPGGNYIHVVTLVSDDPGYMDIELQWGDASDLDLFSLYYDEEIDDWEIIDFSDPGNTLDPIDWTDPDGMYGFSYNYYGGTNNDLDFSSVFTPTGVTLNGAKDPLTFNGTYTLVNKDPNNIQIEQTCKKNGTAFTEFSNITIPATGSRVDAKQEELAIKMRNAIARYKAAHGK